MISREHQAIFFHIPKAAGSSVELKLNPDLAQSRGWQDHRTVREVRPLSLLRHGRLLLDTPRLRDLGLSRKRAAREMVGLPVEGRHGRRATAREFATYYKFTVVRNPWARVYSWYRNVMRDPLHGVPACDFETFLREHHGNWALRPQLHWIEDFDGTVPLDFVARFETLVDDMAEVFRDLGFEDLSLGHALKSKEVDYREAYTDETADLVAGRYREEIARFGYSF